MHHAIFAGIRTNYHRLSAPQKNVADYILEHREEIIRKTLAETARACQVSEPTVLRFLRKIDYTSYQIFRIDLARELAGSPSEINYDNIRIDDSVHDIKQKIAQATAQAVLDSATGLNTESLDECIRLILQARCILVIGVGSSGAIALDLYHKLIKLGRLAIIERDPHMMNIMITNLDANDLVIAISHSGESQEILDVTTSAVSHKVPVAAVTSYQQSSLAQSAQVVLNSSTQETALRPDAMTSRIIQLLVIDILFVSILTSLGQTALDKVHSSRLAVARHKT